MKRDRVLESGTVMMARPRPVAIVLGGDRETAVINAKHVLECDGRLLVTVPETVEASADELAPALQAA